MRWIFSLAYSFQWLFFLPVHFSVYALERYTKAMFTLYRIVKRSVAESVPDRASVHTRAMFTLYRIVKRSVAESVPDRASVHTRTAAFEAVSAPEQYCSAPLLKVERSVSDKFLRRSE